MYDVRIFDNEGMDAETAYYAILQQVQNDADVDLVDYAEARALELAKEFGLGELEDQQFCAAVLNLMVQKLRTGEGGYTIQPW